MTVHSASFFERAATMLCVSSLKGNFLEVNRLWQIMLGWCEQDLVGHAIAERIHEDDQALLEKFLASVGSQSPLPSFECRFQHQDGSFRYLLWCAAVDREKHCIYLTVLDRTEKKKTRDSLVNSQRRLEAVFSSMLEGVVTQEPSGQVVQFNQAALNILGVDADQLLGKASFDPQWRAINEDFSTLAQEQHPAMVAQRTGLPQSSRLMGFRRPGGETRWVSVTAIPLFKDGEMKPYQVVITFHDTTVERNRREENTRKHDEIIRVLNSVPAYISYWDCELKNILANRRYAQIFKREPEDIVGLHIRDVIGPEVYENNYRYMRGALGGTVQNFEMQAEVEPGHFTNFYASYLPDIQNGEVVGFFTVVTDVTRIKQLETERREYESKFVTASKMSSLGEMAAGIAHEINNPLAIIVGRTSILQTRIEKGLIDPARFVDDLKAINATVERVAKTVRGLLSFSRNTEAETMEASSIQKIVDGTLDLCREKFRNRGVELRLELGPLLEVECRANQISQILMNLLNNSNDAIEGGEAPWIAITVKNSSEFVTIRITDSGRPIAPEIAEKLMNPFFTTKELGKGTGLGLSISKGLAQSHGGSLTYDSNNANTSFVLELPIKAKAEGLREERSVIAWYAETARKKAA